MKYAISCDACGHDNAVISRSYRKDINTCEECDRSLCDGCLKEMAVEKGLVSNIDTGLIDDPMFFKCEASDSQMCAECYEAIAESQGC